jgi:two-component system, OmpR family, alkaline phosphatase synthesis response regulator PhoP
MADILLVEDNRELAAAIRYNLELEGYRVAVAADGPSGLDAARAAAPNLLILDVMLPGMDGFEVLERLRADGFAPPVLMLTARGEEADKVRGFRAGADQYLTKPFGLMELIERVRLLLRRHAPQHAPRELQRFGDIEIDQGARIVRRRGREITLTPRAFALLIALIGRNGAVASRLELMKEVWGHRGAVMSRTVDAHVAELRRKLEDDPDEPRHIVTVWKVGYRFVHSPETPRQSPD